jgi:RecB family exonuclease
MSSAPFDRFDGVIGPGFYEKEQWSATAFQNYVNCPFAFMAERIWHLERDEDPGALFEPDPPTRGTLVHRCIDKLVSTYGFDVTEDEIRAQLVKCASDLNLEKILGSRALLDTYLDNVSNHLFNSFLFLGEKRWTPIATEKTLGAILGDLPVRGRIDLLVRRSDGSLLVVDVKTGKPPGASDKIAGMIERGILYQPGVYRALVLADPSMDASPESVSMAYVHIPEGQEARIIELDAETLSELEGSFIANSIEVASLVTEGIFPPVPLNRKCGYCSYGDMCRKSPADRIDWKLGTDSRLGLLRKAGKR